MKRFDEVYNYVKSKLSENRFYHSECVAERCEILARKYNIDIELARYVGIAHDVAKEMPENDKIKYCYDNNIEIDEIELESPGLLHGKIGADIAKKEFGFNEEMCNAIKYHTTGKTNMSMLEKILIVADKSGKDRNFPDLAFIQEISLNNIDDAIIYIIKHEINKTIENRKKLHLNTILGYNDLLKNKN